jgi:hypothetical protein
VAKAKHPRGLGKPKISLASSDFHAKLGHQAYRSQGGPAIRHRGSNLKERQEPDQPEIEVHAQHGAKAGLQQGKKDGGGDAPNY